MADARTAGSPLPLDKALEGRQPPSFEPDHRTVCGMQNFRYSLTRNLKGVSHSEIPDDIPIFLPSPRPFVTAYFHSQRETALSG